MRELEKMKNIQNDDCESVENVITINSKKSLLD